WRVVRSLDQKWSRESPLRSISFSTKLKPPNSAPSLRGRPGDAPALLEAKLLLLFRQQVSLPMTRAVEPYREISPGIIVGFEKTAEVVLNIEAKPDQWSSPSTHINT